jgi:membrane protease YdiL (CAAX protease family)
MRWKDLIFCIAVISLGFLIGKIPVKELLENCGVVSNLDELRYIILGTIIIIACLLIARRKKILISGGFLAPIKKNYWILFLPLFFPGLVFIVNINFGCYNGFLAIGITLITFLIRGLMEEVVFRGVIQGYLRKQYPGKSLHIIILITAILFALIHIVNIQYSGIQNVLLQLIYAFYMGLLFGALMTKVNNVWLLGIVHGVLNTFSVRCVEMQDDYLSKIDLASLLGMLLTFSPVLIIYWLLMRTNKLKAEK